MAVLCELQIATQMLAVIPILATAYTCQMTIHFVMREMRPFTQPRVAKTSVRAAGGGSCLRHAWLGPRRCVCLAGVMAMHVLGWGHGNAFCLGETAAMRVLRWGSGDTFAGLGQHPCAGDAPMGEEQWRVGAWVPQPVPVPLRALMPDLELCRAVRCPCVVICVGFQPKSAMQLPRRLQHGVWWLHSGCLQLCLQLCLHHPRRGVLPAPAHAVAGVVALLFSDQQEGA